MKLNSPGIMIKRVTFLLSTSVIMKKGDHNGNLLKNSTTCEDGADRPGWVPSVRVVVRDGKAQSGVCLKPLRGQKVSM